MTDPYLCPGTDCLQNKLGITDPAELRLIEARIVSIRDVELARETLPGEYNLAHLQAFHRALFRDVYEWAGQIRTVNVFKDGSPFALAPFVQDETSALLSGLEEDNWLRGVRRERFVELLAHYYGELNARHPSVRETAELSARFSVSCQPQQAGVSTGRHLIGKATSRLPSGLCC